MKKQTIYFLLILTIAVMWILCSCQSEQPGGPVSIDQDEQIHGYLYNSDGTPAKNAKIVVVPSEYIPDTLSAKLEKSSGTSFKIEGETDQNGKYSFSTVSAGTYNVFSERNGTVSYHSLVQINSGKNPSALTNDTLGIPGSIEGCVLTNPASDSRKIFILIIGTYVARWPDDSTGKFSIKNVAAGTYKVRFLTTDTSFQIFDTTIQVSSGKITNIGRIVLNNKKFASLTRNYIAMKFGIMTHFNMSTFDRDTCQKCYSVSGEWGLANRDPNIFNPNSINCGQWADAAKASGAKYMILTVKHHDGFCLWNSAATTYDVGSSSWENGKGDVVKMFADSVRSRSMEVGFYYSIRDLTNGYAMSFIKTQLTELLTNYGPITCIWFDGWGWGPGYRAVPFETIRTIIKSIQPACLIVENNHEFNTMHSDIIEYEMPIDGPPRADNTLPTEGLEPIIARASSHEPLWFWHPGIDCEIKSPESVIAQIKLCNQRNANYLLNITPDKTGRLPQCQVDCLDSVGRLQNF